MNPVVSIVVPTYNAENTLDACLLSVSGQTYPHKEVVIIDGGSTDQTATVAQRYRSRFDRFVFVSEKDNGVYDAMNKGIECATGDFLLFLGSDDEFYSPNVLNAIFTDTANHPFDFLYGNVFFKHARAVYSGESSKEKLIGEQVSICHQAIFYRKELFSRVGKYDLKYFIHADYALNVKCFEDPSVRIKYLNEIITLYNEHGLSGTQPNKDGFHDDLTLHYITHYASPFDLIRKIKKQERELAAIKNSKAYKLSKTLALVLAKLRGK